MAAAQSLGDNKPETTAIWQTTYCMEEKILLDLLYQSMQESAREARLSLGRPPSSATREEALQQVAMLKAAKDSVCREVSKSWSVQQELTQLSLEEL